MSSTTPGRLETDRYGVPQYAGEAELFEEYVERAWDLYFGREGQDSLQISTPLHLRAQLTETAYEAVRKLDHAKLRTVTSEGKPTQEGMKLFLQVLRESLAQEAPVRVNELFLDYFYSPGVWRRSSETMQQYIVRREAAFTRLKEASTGTQVSENLKCMLMLIFSGLDAREQRSILASVNNEYDYKKVSHALRIQFPSQLARPVIRKDYLGATRSGGHPPRSQWKSFRKPRQVLAVEDENDGFEIEDEEALQVDDVFEDDDAFDETYVAYSDDDGLDNFLNEMDSEQLEDPDVQEALATLAQHRQGFKKKNFKKPSSTSSTTSGGQQSFPFKASGDLTFDQKAKNQRKAAVDFLKNVTQCTACFQKGHWAGDAECPKGGKGKGKSRGRGSASSPKKRFHPKKTPTNLFVLHDRIESDDEQEAHFSSRKTTSTTTSVRAAGEHVGTDASGSFTDPLQPKISDCLMVLKDTKLCEHSQYLGGEETKFHRSANGHVRQIVCKECDRGVIVARRKGEVHQLWGYLVQIALCTKWGAKARSRELASTIARLTTSPGGLLDAEPPKPRSQKPLKSSAGYAVPESPERRGWELITSDEEQSAGSEAPPPKAKIVYEPKVEVWLYGVKLSMDKEIPPLPELSAEDQHILQPLPGDQTTFSLGRMRGWPFQEVASRPECQDHCRYILLSALKGKPLSPEDYRFAFYLYGRLMLVKGAGTRMMKTCAGDTQQISKRTASPSDMSTTRMIVAPLQYDIADPSSINIHYCDVMMTEDANYDNEEPYAYLLAEYDDPGLAILDSGCTRTMHGTQWSTAYEQALMQFGLRSKTREKVQKFRGVGGETTSSLVRIFPIGIGKKHGELHSAETPGSVPLLLSRPFMQELGAVIDMKNNLVSFEEIGVKDMPLIRTNRGHMAINLLDFNRHRLDDLSSFFLDDDLQPEPLPVNHEEAHVILDDQSLSPQPPSEEYYPPPEPFGDPDYEDHLDEMHFLEMMRQEVANMSDMYDLQPDPEEIHYCEDYDIFESFVSQGGFPVRKTTNKKGKKIQQLMTIQDAEDFLRAKKLSAAGLPKISRKPPVGKTWIKQIFAGQMGITLMAAFLGMMVATPLDKSIFNWDASSRKALKDIYRDMHLEDPYVTVITHPCGPWGSWSRFNIAKGGRSADTVLQLREESRPILRTTNKTIKDRVKAKRHVFVEQPFGSESLDEPEMSDVKKMVDDGTLLFIKVDGCMVGYVDAESGLPHKKPSYYLTTMIAAESIFANLKCSRDHEHQPLEGANKFGPRTAQAAEWPDKLNSLVLECIIQQASIEEGLVTAVTDEAFPSEVRPLENPSNVRPKRRRRQGRVAILTGDYQTPPVYVRPDGQGGELQQPEADDQPDDVPIDDQDFRASKTFDLEPVLNKNEGQRRYEWVQIDPEIRKIVRDLHVQFGHPTAVTLQKILRRQNAKIEAIKAAGLLACDACGESIRRRRPRPVRLPNKYEFNRHILMDTMYAKDVRGVTMAFLNIIDDATGFQVVACLGELGGPPASRAVLRHFTSSWSSWAGLPHSLQVDRGKEYMAIFADHLKQFGVEQEVMPLEAPWKGGKCEKAGHLWKELWNRVVIDSQVSGVDDALTATAIITQTRNSFPRTSGYSPVQWVLGTPELRLPGSLLDDSESQQLEVMEAAEDPQSQMARTLNIRESARVAQVRMDTDARVRRALLRQSTPTRGPFPIGSYVYFFKTQPQPGAQRQYRWFGPARVIGVELRNPRRLEDEDPPTEGGAPHSYWVRYGPSVVLTTGEQMRFASEDELLAAHTVPHYAVVDQYTKGAKSFVDARPFGGALQQPVQQATPPVTNTSPQPQLQQPLPLSGQNPPYPLPQPGLTPVPEEPDLGDPVLEGAEYSPTTPDEVPPQPPQDVDMEAPVISAVPSSNEPEPLPSVPSTPALHPEVLHQPGLPPALPLSVAVLNPDRLDGHGPFRHPNRPDYRLGRELQPYFAEYKPWEDSHPSLEDSVRRSRLQELLSDSDNILDDSASDEEPEVFEESYIMEVFLTGRAVRSEISLKNLSPEDREKFNISMQKEWDSWNRFQAVEELKPEEIKSLPQSTQIVGTRWVHTDKNNKQRLIAIHLGKKTGRSKQQIEKDFPLEAKSRLVVQGCQEDPTGIRSDSPTASLLSFNLICAISVIKNWTLAAYDASTAYLQSGGIERLLILRAPRPPPPGVQAGALFRAKGSIYGTKDAGRSWWKKLVRDARATGWITSCLEAALFFLYENHELVGIMASHVDDLITCGTGSKYAQTLEQLTKDLHLKKKEREFRFCGKNVKQNEEHTEVTLEQVDAIECLDFQEIDKHRRKFPNLPLNEEEKSSFRGLIGSMGWISRQTRPDIMVNVSIASQTMGAPKIKDIVDLNKAVKMLKETPDTKWTFRSSSITLEECVVFVCADSSFANLDGHKSQCGYVIGLASKEIAEGQEAPILLLEANSSSIKRVCRSTLAAESNAFLMAYEAADYVGSLVRELLHPGVSLRNLEKEYARVPVYAFTDAKSLESTINKDAGQPSDKRVKILVAQVKELLENGEDKVIWVDTSQMLADVLTKIGCERELLTQAMESGKWQLLPTEEALRQKQQIREGRHKRKALKRASEGEDG